ncbi:MAG: hypothetical protein ACLR8Y_12895 [Alistipes indistinctus]
MNLNGLPLYTLTESSTASASESLILCLKPYMTVKQVGSSTAGKYCGGSLSSPQCNKADNSFRIRRSAIGCFT